MSEILKDITEGIESNLGQRLSGTKPNSYPMDTKIEKGSLIDQMNLQHRQSILDAVGRLHRKTKLISVNSLPCEITDVLNKYDSVPEEAVLKYKMMAFAAVVIDKNKSISKFATELAVTLATNGGNWIAPLITKTRCNTIDAHIKLDKLRMGLYTTIYEELLKDLKDPLYAFRSTIIHKDVIDQFYNQFVADLNEVKPDTIHITDRELIKIARQLRDVGYCYGYVRYVTKATRSIVLS
jgi:hypothetical protein